jgi:chorismate synthase
MTGNIIGERLILVSFGESHGKCIGAVVEGVPAGLSLAEDDVQRELDLRRPGQSLIVSQRRETDQVEILSGVFQNYTTGAPIAMIVRNEDKDSSAYKDISHQPRPGHADLVARQKYGGFNDWRGGGRFSGRITVSFVMGGAIAKKLLHECLGVQVMAYSSEIGGVSASSVAIEDVIKKRYSNEVRCPDSEAAKDMIQKIRMAKQEGDSLGGVVECIALNVPTGLGEPVFSSLDSDLARIILSIPAVKGVEFGSGFRAAKLKGSENNDQYAFSKGMIMPTSNNAGGILGGLSNGQPLRLRVGFKPASSIAKKQRTVDLDTNEEVELVVAGRHDPTVVPRAVPVVESVVAFTLADHAIRAGLIPPVLKR